MGELPLFSAFSILRASRWQPHAGAELKVAWLDRFESGGSSRGGGAGWVFFSNFQTSILLPLVRKGRRGGWWAVVGGRWSAVGGRRSVGGRWGVVGGGGRGLVRVWRRGTVFGDRLAG